MSEFASNRLEQERLELQSRLDAQKTKAGRNRMGQFATPSTLAQEVLKYGLKLLPPKAPVQFLDPAIGTGSFFSALKHVAGDRRIESALGIEIDPHYGLDAKALWRQSELEYVLGDFTRMDPQPTRLANLLICNPPYVRHHHLASEEKSRLNERARKVAHIDLSLLSGLYCYFIALAHDWMADSGVAGWLIPSEFMEVNYGRELKRYLLTKVTLLHIHRFDPNDVQFDDALVSSAVVWFRKGPPPSDHSVLFTYGGSLQSPALCKEVPVSSLGERVKWTRYPQHEAAAPHTGVKLGDLFAIKRGLATGDNGFFILDEEKAKEQELPPQFLRPILPSTRYVKVDEIEADPKGMPLLEKRLMLLDCDLPEDEVRARYPSLWSYLQTGADTVAKGYLCRSRRFWYAQENRQAAPIVCTYIGRSDHSGRPFRFILNKSQATATNVFLMMYPTPALERHLLGDPTLIRRIWEELNRIDPSVLLGQGRVYGGGMHKLEPKELANVPADFLMEKLGIQLRDKPAPEIQGELNLA